MGNGNYDWFYVYYEVHHLKHTIHSYNATHNAADTNYEVKYLL